MTDIARASGVRNLSKAKWALICLIQCPLDGILYLGVGRIRRPGRRCPERHAAMIPAYQPPPRHKDQFKMIPNGPCPPHHHPMSLAPWRDLPLG